ncbi:mCG1038672 [Mus musculus]|nr:mCG1038672 [Mus musculus]
MSFLLVESRRDNWWPVRGTDSPTEFRTFSSQWLPAG